MLNWLKSHRRGPTSAKDAGHAAKTGLTEAQRQPTVSLLCHRLLIFCSEQLEYSEEDLKAARSADVFELFSLAFD